MIATIQGNIVKDPEVKEFKGKEILEFTVAENMGKDKPARFTKVNVVGPTDFLKGYFKKGAKILAAGSYSVEATKKDGEDIRIWGRIKTSPEGCELVNFAKREEGSSLPVAAPASAEGFKKPSRREAPKPSDDDDLAF